MATVKLLLQESIKNVGRVGDVVEVSPGYARNYLLPQGLAVEPTKGNLKKVEARRQRIAEGHDLDSPLGRSHRAHEAAQNKPGHHQRRRKPLDLEGQLPI